MSRILIMTGGAVAERLAGPAMRALAMATVLASDGHAVTVATTSTLEQGHARAGMRTVAIRPGRDRDFRALERDADLIIFQGHAMEQFRSLATTDRVVVVDAYDPMHLEMLEQGRDQPRASWDRLVRSRAALLNHQLARADLVLCASERQRALYVGQLAALGRVNPSTYEGDPHLERLITVVPFGIDSEPPEARGPAWRGVVPGVDAASRVLIWGGGIYSWFDPLTLVAAVAALHARRPELRLMFLGTRQPGVEPMGMVKDAIALADELGATGRSVFFGEDWVPYAERGAFLLDADAGVSTHHAHVETEFSFRTRILDYVWAGLPMVVTEGDTFADLVAAEGLGIVVPAGDQAALESAIEKVLWDDEFRAVAAARVLQVRERLLWERTLAPLRRFAADPRRAADVEAAGSRRAVGAAARALLTPWDRPGLLRDIRVAWHHLAASGPAEVRRRIALRRDSRRAQR